MTTELSTTKQDDKKTQMKYQGGSPDSVYGLGLIGAWVFYIGRAKTFQEGVVGFFKAFVWPAIVVYKLLELLNKDENP